MSILLYPAFICTTALDALVVGVEAQDRYLKSKKTWTRKVVLVTDGENPIEVDNWDAMVMKIRDLNVQLTIVSVCSPFGVHFLSDMFVCPEELTLTTTNLDFMRKINRI